MSKIYISADGGGTSLRLIAFDEDLRLLAATKTGCVNTIYAPAKTVRRDMAFAAGTLREKLGSSAVEIAYGCIIGPSGDFAAILRDTFGCSYCSLGEGYTHLLAASLSESGGIALAGTGSGAIWIAGGCTIHHGGYGVPIGDEGSGAWIGTRGFNAAIQALDGWGEPTALSDAMLGYLGLPSGRRVISAFYGSPVNQRSLLAGFVPLAGKCAREGDPVAQAIFREAGEMMARQMLSVLRRAAEAGALPAVPQIYASGGAWKATRMMFDSFAKALRDGWHDAVVGPALFDPVMAGVIRRILDSGENPAEKKELLQQQFADYIFRFDG